MEKVFIINPFGIGDVLFTTPVIRAIKKNKPDCLIGYWCNQRVAEFLKSNKKIDRVFALSRGDIKKIAAKSRLEGLRISLKLFFEIKKERFTAALDYSLDHRYGLVCKLAGIKKRVGFDYKGRGRFLTDKLKLDGYSGKHVIDYYLDLLNFIEVNPVGRDLELLVPAQDRERAKNKLAACGVKEGELLIGIVPGGGESWGKDSYLKHWPAENFARLADVLVQKHGVQILILGGEAEAGIAESVLNCMKNKALNLAGKTELAELAALIDNLDILIANDGGPLHMAAALGKKTVSFFGPVDPVVYGPYPADARRHIVLNKKISCQPCYQNFRLSECLRDKECLREISVEEALEAVRNLLGPKEDALT